MIDNETFFARATALSEQIKTERENSVVGMMHPLVTDCDAAAMSVTVEYPAFPWERNPDGVIHGGIVGTMFDTAMGVAGFALTGAMTPTISLTTAFLRPAPGDGTLVVRARITMAGHTVIYLSAEMWDSRAPEQIVATAQGVFRNFAR